MIDFVLTTCLNVHFCTAQSDLNYWLLHFVVKAHCADGQPYPASSISNLLASLYRHGQEDEANCPNSMNRKDPAFKDLTGALQVSWMDQELKLW